MSAVVDKLPQSGPLDESPVSPSTMIPTVNVNEHTEDHEHHNGEHDIQSDGDDDENSGAPQVTVFHNPENFTVKHPLMNPWTLWFTRPPSAGQKGGENWSDLLKEVVTFDSVEEFWGIYNNITRTSDLALKSDYHLFKAGIKPEWEDPANKFGGKWSYQFKDKRSVPIDELWLHTMLSAIGETLEKPGDNEVMGVVVNVRKGFFRVGLWTRTIGNRGGEQGKETLLEIGRQFKNVLRLGEKEPVEFSGHTESANAGSTRARAKYTV